MRGTVPTFTATGSGIAGAIVASDYTDFVGQSVGSGQCGAITGKRAAGPVSDSPDQEHTRRVTLLRGVHCQPLRCRHEKSPLNIEAFNGCT